jgi:hypothetical protein
VIEDLTDFIQLVNEAAEQKKLPKELTEDPELLNDELPAHLEAEADDDELIELWTEGVGQLIEMQVANDDSPLAREWKENGPNGLVTPALWQLDKLLCGENTDYLVPTKANLLEKLLRDAPVVSVSYERIEFMIDTVGMRIDNDGFLRDAETNEYKHPYGYSTTEDRFAPIADLWHDTVDDPLAERVEHTDRIHIGQFGGVIHPCVLPGGSSEILIDNSSHMLDLMIKGCLTVNLKASNMFRTPVLTASEIYEDYENDAEYLR